MRCALLAGLSLAACDRRAPIESCDVRLHGVYTTPAGQRWMLLDNGPTLELFALFDDSVPDGAPRVIDLRRDGKLAGEMKRRFMQRDAICEARAPVTITACKGDTLQVVLADVTSPLAYQPCGWGQQVPSRVEVWHRE
jgi:hypothetical protein